MAGPFQTWSPNLSGSKATKIPRRLVEVPKDQEELLNRSDSWHRVHVPAAILAAIKASHAETQPRSPVTTELSQSAAAPVHTWSPSLLSDNAATIPRQLVDIPRDQDEFLGRTDAYSSPQIPSKLSDHVKTSLQSSRHRPVVVVPSSPTPATQQPKEPQLAAVAELPLSSSSSDSSEYEAEIEIPRAPPVRTDAQQPDLSALKIPIPPGPTPPSAQVIPSTYPEPSATVSPPKPKRQRLMKNVAASLNPADVSMQSTRPSILSLPKPVSSPQPADSSLPPSSSVPASPMAIRTHPAIQPAAVPSMVLRGGGLLESSGSSDRPPPNVPASQDPYNVFKEAYPDYDGSLGDFVRAVLSLIPLQKQNTIPQCILDDYVRVFSGDYLEYIAQLSEDQKPLTTWRWYCKYVPRPLYRKEVLSSDRLKDIRRRYPDKVCEIEAQTTPIQSTVQPPGLQQIQRWNAFSTPAPARAQQHNVQHDQASSPPLLPDSPPTPPNFAPSNIATRSSIHVAELASDPISTAEDQPFEIHSRPSTRRSTGAIGPASKFISASARQSHTQSTRPVNMSASRLSSSSGRFDTQVNFASLETGMSGNSIWDHEDDAMGSVEERLDKEAMDDAPSPSLQSSAEGALQQTAVGISKSRIEYRVLDEGVIGVTKRPWETMDDPEEQQTVQQQCFATFLSEMWGPHHNKDREVRSVM
ncbi:hypothetical protein QBC41DRAFT_305493 [Cercophora samala]|uniref:Uncharacterized protein n=1 Tax=Cercophora samala TaxID=330535 RepID=A0AA39Z8K1_9PEZI|nr:hypothetical protein QBC41DRAFT_305493 [Cercophora samala]